MMTTIRGAGRRVVAALHREDGATAVEYALMLALIAMVIVGAVVFLGQSTNSAYSNSTLTNTLGG